jgi:PAS domain S-box-containing protein
VVISDYYMPRFRAPDALVLLRDFCYDEPVIVVLGKIGEDAAVGILEAGADDYLTKGSMSRLGPAIEREPRKAEVRRERERAEQALECSEDRFRLLSDEAVEGMALIENDVLFDANKSFTRMFGYDPGELVGVNTIEFVVPEDRESVARRISSEDTEPYEIRGLRKDGSSFPIDSKKPPKPSGAPSRDFGVPSSSCASRRRWAGRSSLRWRTCWT